MNRIYRIVWNRVLGLLQVASELAGGARGGASLSSNEVARIRRGRLKRISWAILLALPFVANDAYAACTPASPADGQTVTCNGAANPLAPSYSAAANNLTVNVNGGSSVGVLLGLGGTALTLSGNNVTLNNAGTIDPSLLGLLSLLSSGTTLGNGTASTMTVNNQSGGLMKGTSGLLGANIGGLTGMALTVHNGAGGVSNITNAGSIGSSAILGVTLINSDAPVVAAYGGAQVNMVNTGTITGRVAFEGAAAGPLGVGNTFANSGTISGGVSMGSNRSNTFTAVSGSGVNDGGSLGAGLNVLNVVGLNLLNFAGTGVIDGGAGGNNTLVLQNVLPSAGTGSGTGGPLTNVADTTYINFQHLTVNSGTWNLQGAAVVSTDATLNGGLANFNNGAAFGTGTLTGNGGAMAASTAGLTVANNVLLNASGLTLAGSNNFGLSGVISGTGGLTQTNTAQVTLTGINAFTGATSVDAGTLALSGGGSIASSSGLSLATGGQFNIAGVTGNTTISALTGTAGTGVALGGNTLNVGNALDTTFAGIIGGTGGITKQGTGTLTLSGVNNYTGLTSITGGTLALQGAGRLAAVSGLNIAANGRFDISAASANQTVGAVSGAAGSQILLGANTLSFGNASNSAFAGVISGTGGVEKLGTGTLTLSGANLYLGGTTINAGTLALSATGSIAPTGALTINGGTFDISGGSNTTVGALSGSAGAQVLLGGNSLTVGDATNTTYAGTLAGAGALIKQGSGLLILSGANTYGGGTTIAAGSLQGDATSLQGNIVDNASLIFNQGVNGTFAGTISGSGSLTKLGAGTLTLSGVNSYGGGTTINAGALQGDTSSLQGNINDNASLIFNQGSDGTFAGAISGSGSLTKQGAGTLTLSGSNSYGGGTTISAGALQGDSTSLQGDITDNASLIFNQGTDGTFAGALSGSGSLTKLGNGTLTLSGANTYSGGTTIGAGALQGDTTSLQGDITDNASLIFNQLSDGSFAGVISGSGSLTKLGAGTLTLSGANSYGGGTTISAGALQGDSTSLQGDITDNASLIFNQGGNGTFTGAISGSGSLTKQGAGTLVLSGTNSYSGGTVIAAGELQGDTNSLQGDITNNGTLTFNQVVDGSYTGNVSGSGDLIKGGAGTLTLTGANTYSGGTSIKAGVLALGAGASLAPTGGVTLAAGAGLDISAAAPQTMGGVDGGGGEIVLGANTLTIDNAGTDTFAGVLSGTGGLIKQGTGTQVLTGVNTYTGGTQILGGTLSVGSGGSIASSSPVTLGAAGTLDLSAGGNQTLLALAGAGVVNVGGNTLTLGGGSYDGVIEGAGALIKNTAGTLTLNGVNTYLGGTTVQAGSLVVGGDATQVAASLASGVQVQSGGSLGGFGTVNGAVEVQAGGALTPGIPNGTLTVAGDLTLDQGALINFSLGAPGAGGTFGAGHNVQVNGNLSINGASLSVANAGGFGPGIYNLFNYTGTLTYTNGGILPPGVAYEIQNLTASKQINLFFTGGSELNFWNANGLASPTQMGGGSGTWSVVGSNWTDANGSITGPRVPVDAFSIFGGEAGTVTVDNGVGGLAPVTAQGMQFASDGYHLVGDELALVAPTAGALSEIRVGDGSAASAAWVATIDNVLSGLGLNKTGAGTLVLTGNNTYTQSTMLSAGALSVSSDASLGAAGASLDFEGGTLQVTGTSFNDTARSIVFGAGGAFDIADAGNTFTVSQALGGSGALTKLGAGTLVLSGANSYTGGTTVSAGTLQGDSASLQGNIANNAMLVFDQAADGSFVGAISGSGALTKNGAGTLVLSGANSYTGGTTISAGTLQGDASSLQGSIVNQAALIFDQAATGTFNGSVSGNGSLSKTGAGTLVLNGANSYTGGTTISAGALQGDTTSLQGDITDNASLIFNLAGDGSFAGVISGSGSLTMQGTGTLTLSGTNTYSGGTTISAGALQGDTSSLQGDITDNASLIFNQGSDDSFAGVISGSGSLTKLGAGTLTLSGANTYSGGTTISAGALQGDTSSLQGNIADNASLIFNQGSDGAFAGAISGSGSLTKQGAGTLTLSGANTYGGGTTISAGALLGDTTSLQGNITDNASLIFNQQNNGSFAGSISGTGAVTKTGAGTLTINTVNPVTGQVTVQQGTLIVGDDSHPGATLGGMVMVNSGATLHGTGTIGHLDLSGTAAPGNSIGTLYVAGNAVFQAGSSYDVTINGAGQSSLIAVSGTATLLGGTTLVLAQPGSYAPQTTYTILTAAQGVSGTFGQVSSGLTFLTPVLGYLPDAVTLSLVRNGVPFDDSATTPNGGGAARGADGLAPGDPVNTAITLLDPHQAGQAFELLTGEVSAATQTALFDESHYVRDAVNNHLLDIGADAQQGKTGGANGATVWSSIWGRWGDRDGDGQVPRMQANSSGLIIGADLPLGDARLGGLIGTGQGSVRVNALTSDAQTHSTYLGLYGDAQFDAFRLRGGAMYAWQTVHAHRDIVFPNFSGRVDSRYDADTAQAYLEGGYRIPIGAFTQLEPFASVARVQVHTDAYSESGSPAALTFGSVTANQTLGALGLRGVFALGAGGLRAHVGAAWQHAWGDTTPLTSARFVSGGPGFDVQGLAVARNAGIAEVGLRFPIARNASVDASYYGQFASRASDQSARLTLTVSF